MCMDIGKAIKDIRVKSLLSQANFKTLKKIKEFCTRNEIDFNVDVYISE